MMQSRAKIIIKGLNLQIDYIINPLDIDYCN